MVAPMRDVLRGDADGRAMEDMEYSRANEEASRSDREASTSSTARGRHKQQLRNWEANERAYRMDEARGGAIGMEDGVRKESTERLRRNQDLRRTLDENRRDPSQKDFKTVAMKKGGAVKMAAGGKVRGDGCCARGKTKGRYI